IQAHGIVPDIIIERAKIESLKQDDNITEADLSGHLRNGDGKESTSRNRRQETNREAMNSDNQLLDALILLKGLNVLGANLQQNPAPAAVAHSDVEPLPPPPTPDH